MVRKSNLSVACLIDGDIVERVTALSSAARKIPEEGEGGHEWVRAKYDASIVLALRRNFTIVRIVKVESQVVRTLEALERLQPDVIFNLSFSGAEEESWMAGCLEMLGIPFTGSGSLGIALTRDKARSAQLARLAGVRVPATVELLPNRPIEVDLMPPLIVKPASLSGSVGIHARSLVDNTAAVEPQARRIWNRYGVSALCQEFIIGREFRVALVEDDDGRLSVVRASEWHFESAAPGHGYRTEAMKASRDAQRHEGVSRTLLHHNDRKQAEFTRIGRAGAGALGVTGYATLDVRMRDDGQMFMIELNSNPGIWAGGSTWSRPSFSATLRKVVNAALRRRRS